MEFKVVQSWTSHDVKDMQECFEKKVNHLLSEGFCIISSGQYEIVHQDDLIITCWAHMLKKGK